MRAEGIDLGIRYCPRDRAPAGALRLFDEIVVPVAHPALAARPVTNAAAIADHVLLEFDGPPQPQLQWRAHLHAAGFGDARPKGVLRFNQYDQAIQAAIAGQASRSAGSRSSRRCSRTGGSRCSGRTRRR